MYKTILVPLDGSERAEAILPHVENLGRCYQAKIILLQVVEPPPQIMRQDAFYEAVARTEVERWKEEAQSYLAGLQAEFKRHEIESEVRVVHGYVVETITQVAEQEGADLIAMASQGRTGLARVFYGSVAAGVLHRVDRPLLLIRSLEQE
jgi:nucleotide-binding universal stress UspA family protein